MTTRRRSALTPRQLIVCDTGPIVSALNRNEGQRHLFAVELLARLGRRVLVPWPIVTEVDLLLRSRGHPTASFVFARAPLDGVHQFDAPTEPELALALDIGEQYADSGVDLTDLTVMAMAHTRDAAILTWDFRHFRSVVLQRDHHWALLVEEHELPSP